MPIGIPAKGRNACDTCRTQVDQLSVLTQTCTTDLKEWLSLVYCVCMLGGLGASVNIWPGQGKGEEVTKVA